MRSNEFKFKNTQIMIYWDVYDDETGKTFHFKAETLDKAIELSEQVNYSLYPDGEEFPNNLNLKS